MPCALPDKLLKHGQAVWKHNKLNKHTHTKKKLSCNHVFSLSILMLTEYFIAYDGHQNLVHLDTCLNSMSRCIREGPGALWLSLGALHKGAVHDPIYERMESLFYSS